MLQKTHSLVLYKLINHVMQYSSYSVKTFVGLAYIVLEQHDESFSFYLLMHHLPILSHPKESFEPQI